MGKLNRLMICIFLVSTITISGLCQVKADVVFQDDFHSGNFDKWMIVGSPKVVTSPAANSNASAQFSLNTTNTLSGGYPDERMSYLQAPYPSSNVSALEFFVLIDTFPPNTPKWVSENGTIVVAEICGPYHGRTLGETTVLVDLVVMPKEDGSFVWAFFYPDSNGIQTKYISSPQANTWYKFNISVFNHTINLSINDSLAFKTTDQFNWNPTVFRIGNVLDYNYSSGNVYIDDVIVSQSEPIPSPDASNIPSPSVPELSWLAIIPLMVTLLSGAVIRRNRRTTKLHEGLQ
jgi:hypothetical protein